MQYVNTDEKPQQEPLNNIVMLSGVVTEVNANSEQGGTHDFVLGVNRLSGMQDRIPVIMSDEVKNLKLRTGQIINVKGIFTSFNKIIGDRSKLILTVMATEIYDTVNVDQENPNSIDLFGFICKTPIYRTTPFNREIADLLLAVNRSFNKSDYIPAIAWGKNARFAKNLLVGEKVQINGRIQSREYQKRFDDGSVETRTAYEVSINAITRID
ncbi:MAG: single-stranded DNA-binding protein [Christensenellaceae bacterium]|jgi:primosomal replication protein N|nr:single-stranded DNA-binding protein [Christensenellaceae bacterium]